MSVLDRILGTEDVPTLHQCGRECSDGSPCRNVTRTIGAACLHHPADDPRVDGGPEDPSEVPLSDASRWIKPAAVGANVLGASAALTLGFGPTLTITLSAAAAIATVAASAYVLNACQRLAVSRGMGAAEN